SALPPILRLLRLALKLFRREPAISMFDWLFTPTHTSSPHFSTYVGSGLQPVLPGLHPGHGQITWYRVYDSVLLRPIYPRFRYGSMNHSLNRARNHNSPVHSAKGTPPPVTIPKNHQHGLRLHVGTRFQVLFHSPLGVLFTFPSRYWFTIGHYVVFSLGRWSSRFPAEFLVIHRTQDPLQRKLVFDYRAITFYGSPFQLY